MQNILLVLGDVPPEQYDRLRHAMKRALGQFPRVIVVPWEYATPQIFIEKAVTEFHQRYPKGTTDRAQAWFLAARPGQLEDVYINQLFGDASTDDVKAIVFGARDDDEYPVSRIDFGWLTRNIPYEVPAYRVVRSEADKTTWLSGSGFGDLRK